jgi:hypothetical protein
MSETKQYQKVIEETINNVRSDRAHAQALLTKLLVAIQEKTESQRDVGVLAAKYLETLQKSNETLVKVANLLKTKDELISELSEEDKAGIYDLMDDSKEK